MSLAGKRIVNTRAAHQAADLDALLRAHGAIPLSYPCIAILPPVDTSELEEALSDKFGLLVLTSVNTVLSLAALDVPLTRMRAAAVGEATAQAAEEQLGVEISLISGSSSAAGLADELRITPGMRILLPQSEIAPPTLAEALRARGAHVTAVTAYRTVRGSGGVDVPRLLADGLVDAVTLTSASTARYFVERTAGADLQGVCLASIGAQTSQTARDCGLTVTLEAAKHTLEGLAAAINAYFGESA